MTEREIKKYIDLLNNGKSIDSIFNKSISKTVDISKVWMKQSKKTDFFIKEYSFQMFFIKNDLGIYVGAIQNGGNDLHWYILPKYRKQGHLTTALKETILPYIFCNERESQRITIQEEKLNKNYHNSKNVALKVGFTPINEEETEFELTKQNFQFENTNIFEQRKNIGYERIEILQERINYASNILLKISDELLMSYGDDENLFDISLTVRNYTDKIDSLMWKYETK